MSKAKRNALLFLFAAGILVIVLAMSLSNLSLSRGESFSLGTKDVELPGVADEIPGTHAFLWLLRGLLAMAITLLPFYIIYSLLSAKGRRRLLKNLVFLVLLFWLANYLDKHPPNEDASPQEVIAGGSSIDLSGDPPVAVFSEEEAPSWLAAAVILVAAAFGVGLFGTGLWVLRQRMARAGPSLQPLAEAAQETIDSLRAGGDFRTAIIRCYHEMNRIVREERGLEREVTSTPREFEIYLVSRGLPQNAVETLTRLFEQVRYGSMPSRPEDEAAALACLSEIAGACKPAEDHHGQ